MRLVFLVGSTSYSGAEKVLMALAKSLATRGHDVHLVLTEMAPAPLVPGLECHSVVARQGPRPLRTIDRIRRIRRAIRYIRPDVAIGFGYHNSLNLSAALVMTRVPMVLTERTNPQYYPPGRTPRVLRRIFYGLADACVFQTDEIRSQFPARLQRRSAVIANPVTADSDLVSDDCDDEDPNRKQRVKSLSVVAVSRLSEPEKNLSLLIRCFKSLTLHFPEWRLDIYGSGPDQVLYEKLILELELREVVFLRGHTTTPTDVMQSASVYVLASRTEGMPNSLIEAMSLGIACVATDCDGGGARALITSGVDGILVDNESMEGLRDGLRALMASASLRDRLGLAARSVNDRLSMTRITEAWLGVFAGVRSQR